MNRIILLGNLTSDPIKKETEKALLAKSIIAVDRDKENSDFFKLVAFGRTAEYLLKYGHKGSKVALEGRMKSEKYVDKNGNNQYAFEVVVDRVWVLNRKEELSIEEIVSTNLEGYVEETKVNKVLSKIAEDDDLPF
jgi:single-strand DNA-binding protein